MIQPDQPEIGFYDAFVEYLPSITSIWGFLLYGIFSYLVTLCCTTCIGKFVNKNVDL
jgi:hypothetical protein